MTAVVTTFVIGSGCCTAALPCGGFAAREASAFQRNRGVWRELTQQGGQARNLNFRGRLEKNPKHHPRCSRARLQRGAAQRLTGRPRQGGHSARGCRAAHRCSWWGGWRTTLGTGKAPTQAGGRRASQATLQSGYRHEDCCGPLPQRCSLTLTFPLMGQSPQRLGQDGKAANSVGLVRSGNTFHSLGS